jgi:hypothetical protein
MDSQGAQEGTRSIKTEPRAHRTTQPAQQGRPAHSHTGTARQPVAQPERQRGGEEKCIGRSARALEEQKDGKR